ncbi:K(+)-transporting ATPase subunit F [Catenulispora sp. MAP5-51]
MSAGTVVGLIVGVGLLVYLVLAVRYPEKF